MTTIGPSTGRYRCRIQFRQMFPKSLIRHIAIHALACEIGRHIPRDAHFGLKYLWDTHSLVFDKDYVEIRFVFYLSRPREKTRKLQTGSNQTRKGKSSTHQFSERTCAFCPGKLTN